MRRVARFTGVTIVAFATIGTIVGIVVLALLTPLWVFGEQDRVGSAALSGYTAAEVRIATGAILGDLIAGPPDFDVAIRDEPVLNDNERAHLREVRTAFLAFFAIVGVAFVVLLISRRRSHGSAVYWRGVRAGGSLLAVVVAALAGFAIFAFAVLFEVFHQVLFPPGSYTFNPATDRIVQLFPERFWFDTTIVLAIGLMLSGLASRSLAGRRLTALAGASQRRAIATSPPPPDQAPSDQASSDQPPPAQLPSADETPPIDPAPAKT
jgi:integral membrane protein (TIGR01906 family)